MKAQTLLSLFAVGLTLVGSSALSAKDKSADQADKALIQVEVRLPANMASPMVQDDAREIFVDSMREAFRKRGYRGDLDEREFNDDAKADTGQILISLFRWETSRTGMIECSFSAEVVDQAGNSTKLGSFMAQEMAFTASTRFDRGENFRRAAEDAANQLWKKLEKQDLLEPMGLSVKITKG